LSHATKATEAADGWRVLLSLLVVFIGWLALTPRPPPQIDFGWDKLNHVLAFSALAFSAGLGWAGERRACWLASAVLVAYGGLIEILQLWVPGRTSEWGDLLGDTVGVACGMALALGWLRLLARAHTR